MNVAIKANKHVAPGPYLGFALQPVRLCFHLLTCPRGARVSLEVLDDVAIHHPDGVVTLEQAKSALKHNPLSDWSVDLWKTIANWADCVSEGQIVLEKSTFRLYVTPAHTGALAQALNDATNPADVALLIATIEAGHAKRRKARASSPFIDRFLATSHDTKVAIIANLEVASEGDPIEALRALLRPTVDPQLIDLLCAAAIGMAKDQADQLIREGEPALIDADAFKASFRAFIQKNNLPGLLASFNPAPPQDQVVTTLTTRPTFIRQLEIIDTSQEDRLRAVSDFLRTSADKSIWAEKGLVFEGSLLEWDDDLIRRHGLIRGEIADLHAQADAALTGRLVYWRCAQLQAPLDGRTVPGHFVHGCFNSLANEMRLGWHPDYHSILGENTR